MDAVVTEELRSRSALGREIVEAEEAVDLVEQFDRAVNVSDPPVELPPSQAPVERQPLNRGLGVSMEELAAWSLERARGRSAERAAQPNAKEFLARPYYAYGRNRFLFSCADEPDGYTLNRADGWNYTLPEPAGGSTSSDTGR